MPKNFTSKTINKFVKKLFVVVFMLCFCNTINAQYCSPAGALDCTFNDYISNVTFGSINNSTTCNGGGYTSFAASTTITGGNTYPISVGIGPGGTEHAAVWIDFNNNGTFDASEFKYLGTVTTAGNLTSSIVVPSGAIAGNVKMRVRVRWLTILTATDACTAAGTWGEVEDYNITILPAPPCTGTPAPGNTLSSATSICAGVPFTLSLQNNTAGSGVTYQWQSAALAAGPWTPIGGATSNTYTGTQTASTFYRCVVTCGGNSTNSNSVQVLLTPASGCYCTSVASSPVDEDIFNVTFGTLNNSSTCATTAPGPGSIKNQYSNYKAGAGIPATPSFIAGSTSNNFSVTIDKCGTTNYTNSLAAWIDYNQDGAFTANERIYVSAAGTSGPHTETANVIIPSSAVVGLTTLRVVCNETATPSGILPCNFTGYTWGETEDYFVNITPCIPVSITTQPANASISCGGSTTFGLVSAGTAANYVWQYRVSATAPWLNVVNAAPFSGATTATLNVTNAAESFNGYQFRAVYSGACTSIDYSNIVTLNVTAYLAPISPANVAICTGSSVQLFASPAPAITAVASAANLNVAIPDGAIAGINNTLAVSGIPAGATISNISIKVNIPHTYISDLMLVIKAPNGKVLNLSNLIGGANNPGANFTNTVFSSTATAALNTGISPGFTGSFKPDGAAPVGAFGIPSGPTGYAATAGVTTFNTLIPASADCNGNWVLAMYDAGPPDVGTLKDWSISITWGVTPATAIFTPATNLWLNAGLTTPYVAGTSVNNVYTNTATSQVYNAVVTNGTCTANANFNVTVNTPVAGTLVVADKINCAGANTTFAYTGLTAGTGLTHQWQVSTDGGTTFTNIAGETNPTLTLVGTTAAMSNNRYRVLVGATSCTPGLTSAAGKLTINTTPVVNISVAPLTKLFPGLTTTVSAVVTNATAPITYEWFKNGATVAGATAGSYVLNVAGLGSYTVIATDANGCKNTATTPAQVTISDSATSNILFIYPSPNTGKFQVRYYFGPNDETSNTFVNVYDERGARVFTKPFAPGLGYGLMDVDLGAHGRGIYRVDLLDGKGNRLKTGSVMVY